MAGSKTVPLTWGVGGEVIGTATIDENGIVMAEIEDEYAHRLGLDKPVSLSIYPTDDRS